MKISLDWLKEAEENLIRENPDYLRDHYSLAEIFSKIAPEFNATQEQTK